MIEAKTYVETIWKYLSVLDNTFDKLSHKFEGEISHLPSYVFSRRQIIILKFNNLNYFFVKIIANNKLDTDKAFTGIVSSNEELNKYSNPFIFDFDFNKPIDDYKIRFDNVSFIENNNINAIPILDICVIGIVKGNNFFEWFSEEAAKKKAIDEWNNIGNKLDRNNSFIYNLKGIFDKFELILNKESFLERRLHRFLNAHSLYLLPSYVNCFFEHELFYNGEKRKADFILERETGFPALLIELESSFHKVFKSNNELTVYSNHAEEQISEWVRFIDSNSANVDGKMQFLVGPKNRLIIIGRGLNNIDAMKNTKFSSSAVWTYDMMIKEAKDRWNKVITDQCNLIGIKNPNLL